MKFRLENIPFTHISITLLVLVFVSFGYRSWFYTPKRTANLIEADLLIIAKTLKEIDDTCSILSVKYDRNFLDFFTVPRGFEGSEVGPLNLANPENWEGPYFKDNPSMKGFPYEVVQGADGYFVVPPQSVALPNGKIIGQDIIITKDTEVLPMIRPGGELYYKGFALARKLDFKIGDINTPSKEELETMRVKKELREAGHAVPFAHNSHHHIAREKIGSPETGAPIERIL